MGMNEIETLPDISFINNMTLEDVESMLIEKFKEHYKESTGTEIVLEKSDPCRLLLLSQAVVDYQMLLFIDKCGKMNFLKYSTGNYLDHMGAFKNRPRAGAKKAEVEVVFSLAEIRDSAESIPVGTVVTADQKVFFETVEYAEIPAGELSITVTCVCTVAGNLGNNYAAGEISMLVTPVGFISSVTNITKSGGGMDEETDSEYKEGIYQAPEKYSVAGPDPAWISIIKEFNRDVADVMPDTEPGSGVASFTIVMKRGRLPGEDEIEKIREYLKGPDIKTIGIDIEVRAPEVKEYDICLTYYIPKSSKERIAEIGENVRNAVVDYICWQGVHEEIVQINEQSHDLREIDTNPVVGRDINPDDLIFRLKRAGIKRAEITYPVFTKVEDNQIARFSGNVTVVYGGVESD